GAAALLREPRVAQEPAPTVLLPGALVASLHSPAPRPMASWSCGGHPPVERAPDQLRGLRARGRALVIAAQLQGRRGPVEILDQLARLLLGAAYAAPVDGLRVALRVLDGGLRLRPEG